MSKSGKDGPVGVLNDFDLSTIEGSMRRNEHVGTVPFMAIDLLSKRGLAGEISHKYEHDLESFLWVLSWICLRYDKGKLRVVGKRPLSEWAKVDARTCGQKKLAFLSTPPRETPGEGYESVWPFAFACLEKLQQFVWTPWSMSMAHADSSNPSFEETFVKPYQKLLNEPMKEVMSKNPNFVNLLPPRNFVEVPAVAWRVS